MRAAHKCCAEVQMRVSSFRWIYNPCGRGAKFCEDDKWYCGRHSPANIARKDAARTAAWEYRSKMNAADARLRAAAPDLLAACHALLNDEPGAHQLATAAINKAEGHI